MCDLTLCPSEENAAYFKFYLMLKARNLLRQYMYVKRPFLITCRNTRNSRIVCSRRGWEINKIYNTRTKTLFFLLIFFLRLFIHAIVCAKAWISFYAGIFWCPLKAKFVMSLVALGLTPNCTYSDQLWFKCYSIMTNKATFLSIRHIDMFWYCWYKAPALVILCWYLRCFSLVLFGKFKIISLMIPLFYSQKQRHFLVP